MDTLASEKVSQNVENLQQRLLILRNARQKKSHDLRQSSYEGERKPQKEISSHKSKLGSQKAFVNATANITDAGERDFINSIRAGGYFNNHEEVQQMVSDRSLQVHSEMMLMEAGLPKYRHGEEQIRRLAHTSGAFM